MKRCGQCGKIKPERDFHKSRRHGHQAWCRPCRKDYDAAYHQRNKARRLEQKRRLHARFTTWYLSLKEGKPCTDCGLVFDPVVMQWDHVPGVDKVGNLSDLKRRHNRPRLLAEIEKCELVCANCHAIRTLARRGA